MNKIEILEELFKSKDLIRLIKSKLEPRNCLQYFEDFKQDLYVILLEKDDSLILDLHKKNKLQFYTIRIVLNQISSTSSPFYKTYLANTEDTNADLSIYSASIEEDITSDFDVLKYCNENSILSWYELNMLSIYYQLGEYSDTENKATYRGIEEEYNIDHISIYLTVQEAIRKIKEHVEKNYY